MALDHLPASKHVERRSCATQNAYIMATCDTWDRVNNCTIGFRTWAFSAASLDIDWLFDTLFAINSNTKLGIKAYHLQDGSCPVHSSRRQCPILQSIFHTWNLLSILVLNGMGQQTKLLSTISTKACSMCTWRLLSDLSISTHLMVTFPGILMRAKSLILTFDIATVTRDHKLNGRSSWQTSWEHLD